MALKDRIRETAAAESSPAPFRRSNGRASYPHRVSLDLDDERYEWLRAEAYSARVPIAGLLRAVVSLMSDDQELRRQVAKEALREYPPPS